MRLQIFNTICAHAVYESGGLFYYRMVDRVLFGLTVSNIVVLFWLASVKLWGYAVMVAPIPLIVVAFGRFAREAPTRSRLGSYL